MHTWKLTHLDTPEVLAEGTRSGRAEAWAAAITAAMDVLTEGACDRFRIVIDGRPALLIAGRKQDGALDVAATRAAAERMAAACCGVPF